MSIFKAPFEVNKVYPMVKPPKTLSISKNVLTNSKLFSPAVLSKAIIDSLKNKNNTFVKKIFAQENALPLSNYIKIFIKKNILGGNSISIKPIEFSTKYSSPLLQEIRTSNPLIIGDPNAMPINPFQTGNSIQTMKRYTGKSSSKVYKKIIEVNDKSYITTKIPVFNGKSTINSLINPWTKEVPIEGNDSFFRENLVKNTSTISLFYPYFNRNLKMKFLMKYTKETIETRRYVLDYSNF